MDSGKRRQLLVGIMAWELGLLDDAALSAGIELWQQNQDGSLSEVFVKLNYLDKDAVRALETLSQRRGDTWFSRESTLANSPAIRNWLNEIRGRPTDSPLSFFSGEQSSTPSISATEVEIDRQRFEVEQVHARGGLGVVSRARDPVLHRTVAIKEITRELADDPDARRRLLFEAEITGRLEHPGVVPIYGIGRRQDGRPFYVMRLVRGETLDDAIGRFHTKAAAKKFREDRRELLALLRRFIDICNTIEYAHGQHVLHRDLKPRNIMIGEYGETIVIDWGLARHDRSDRHDDSGKIIADEYSSDNTSPGAVLGTPRFMSPEQATGDVQAINKKTDVFGLGSILYQILTGRAPFQGEMDRNELLERARSAKFPLPRSVDSYIPVRLDAICCKAMARLPADRYHSARELASDVEAWIADEPILAYSDTVAERLGRRLRRHRQAAMAAVVALLVIAVTGVISSGVIYGEKAKSEKLANEKSRLADHNLQLADREQEISRLAVGAIDKLLTLSGVPAEVIQRRLMEEARPLFTRVLELSTDQGPFQRLFTQEKLLVIDSALGHDKAALTNGMEVARALANELELHPERDDLQSALARVQWLLGELQDKLGDPQAAIEQYSHAERHYRNLHQRGVEREKHLRGLALALGGRAETQMTYGNHAAALSDSLASLEIRREIAREFPSARHSQDLAMGLLKIGRHYFDSAQLEPGQSALTDAIKAMQEAVSLEPTSVLLTDLASTRRQLAVLYEQRQDFDAARTEMNEAFKALEKARHTYVPQFRRTAMTLHVSAAALGVNECQVRGGAGEKGRKLLQDAEHHLNQVSELASNMDALFAENLELRTLYCSGLTNHVSLLALQGKFGEAKAVALKLNEALEPLRAAHPDHTEYLSMQAANFGNLGVFASIEDNDDDSLRWAEKTIQLLEHRHQSSTATPNMLGYLGRAYALKAQQLDRLGQNEAALENWSLALPLGSLTDRGPWLMGRAITLGRLGQYEDALHEVRRLEPHVNSAVLYTRVALVYSLVAQDSDLSDATRAMYLDHAEMQLLKALEHGLNDLDDWTREATLAPIFEREAVKKAIGR